jgi:hypothetical protein
MPLAAYMEPVEEKISRGTRAPRMAASRVSDPVTLTCQYRSGWSTDSPAAMRPAKCSTPSNPGGGGEDLADVVDGHLVQCDAGGEDVAVSGGQVVEDLDFVACVDQAVGDHPADVAETSGDQQFHDPSTSFRLGDFGQSA